MAEKPNKGGGGSSANPAGTKQWEGHLRHQRHLAEQERERRLRRGLSEKKPGQKT